MLSRRAEACNQETTVRNHALLLAIASLISACATADEPITLPRQPGWVGALAFAPDGRQLVVGTGAGSVSIWDLKDAKKPVTLQGHSDAVAALAWSSNGRWLVSGGHDHVALVHDLDQKSAGRYVLNAHTGAVLAVALSSDGKRIYTGGIDATIREWETETRKITNVSRGHTSWVNSLAIDRANAVLASASSDNSLQLRGTKGLEGIRTFRVKEGEIRAVAFSPDCKLVAGGIRYGGLRVWSLDDGREVAALKAHTGETWAVAFTPDGKTLVSGGGDWNQPGEVCLWEVGTWKRRTTLAHTGEVLSLAISADGRLLAAGSWDRTVRIWDLTRR
jgi:WD40 repeat protein